MARISIGIAFAPTALLPLYGADVGFADMTEVLAEREDAKRQRARRLQGARRGGRRERRGAADAGHERGVPARLRACARVTSISPFSASRATAIR